MKIRYALAALAAITIVTPSIASAETTIIRNEGRDYNARAEMRGHHDHGWHHHHDRKVVIIKHRHHHD
jgi:hypothetical protein